MLTVTAETKSERFAATGAEHPLHHIERGILKFCGFDILPAFVVADVYDLTDAQRRQKLTELAHHVGKYFNCSAQP